MYHHKIAHGVRRAVYGVSESVLTVLEKAHAASNSVGGRSVGVAFRALQFWCSAACISRRVVGFSERPPAIIRSLYATPFADTADFRALIAAVRASSLPWVST